MFVVDKVSPFPDLLGQSALSDHDAISLGIQRYVSEFYERWKPIGSAIEIRTEELDRHSQSARITNYGTPRDFSTNRCELIELVLDANPQIICPAGVRLHYFIGFDEGRLNVHTTTWLHPEARGFGIMSAYTSRHLQVAYFEKLAMEVAATDCPMDAVRHVATRSDENSVTRLLEKSPMVSGLVLEERIKVAQRWNHLFLERLRKMGYEDDYTKPYLRDDVAKAMGSSVEVITLSRDYSALQYREALESEM